MNEPRDDGSLDPEWANLFRETSESQRSVQETLRDVPIFSLLDQGELSALERMVHVRHYAPGECIVRAGVPQFGFYVIQWGAVEILRQQEDGTREVVDVLGPGELLGEFGLLDDTPRSSDLVALEPSRLIGFFRPDLMDILDTRPTMGCRILLRLGEQMARALNRDYRALRQASRRVARLDGEIDSCPAPEAP